MLCLYRYLVCSAPRRDLCWHFFSESRTTRRKHFCSERASIAGSVFLRIEGINHEQPERHACHQHGSCLHATGVERSSADFDCSVGQTGLFLCGRLIVAPQG